MRRGDGGAQWRCGAAGAPSTATRAARRTTRRPGRREGRTTYEAAVQTLRMTPRGAGQIEALVGTHIDAEEPAITVTTIRRLPSQHIEVRFHVKGGWIASFRREWDFDGVWLIDASAGYSPDEIRTTLRRWVSEFPQNTFNGPRLDMRVDGETRRVDDPGGGWIAPDGTFYPTPDGAHQSAAERIAIARRIRLGRDDPAYHLEQRGWLHVMDHGMVYGVHPTLTQAQMDRLFDIAQRHASMRGHIMNKLSEQQQCNE